MTSNFEHDALLPLPERRRTIFERAVAKYRALGTPIDNDPAFVELVGKWIDGDVDMRDVARSYGDLRCSGRRHAPPEFRPVGISASGAERIPQEKLMAELEQVIGIYDPE